MIKKIIWKLLRFAYYFPPLVMKINWIKTIYFNFKMLPLKKAAYFPVFFFGRVKFMPLNGKLIINGSINTGMIQFGKDIDGLPASSLPVKVYISGSLVFNGPAVISGGTNITVWDGVINIGQFCYIGSGVTLKSVEGIMIGDYSRIASNVIGS